MLRDYPRIIGNLPWMTVHGDFHFWNVLYRADQIAAVVDYDFVQERERIFDIAYALQNVVEPPAQGPRPVAAQAGAI